MARLACRAAVVGALAGALVTAVGCRERSHPAPVDAGVATEPDLPTAPLTGDAARDPVGAVVARLPGRPGACAQVRSLRDRAEADSSAAAIRSATGLAVEVAEKDLGPRGIWFRVCVGDEPDEARLVAKATRWTAPDGVLAPFLDPPSSPDEARFLVLPRSGKAPTPPTLPQARAFLERSAAGAAFTVSTAATPALAGTSTAGDRVVVVDAEGHVLGLDPSPPAGCASCAVAEQQSPVTARRVLAVGDVLPSPGDELLLEESTGDGTRFLAVAGVIPSSGGPTIRRLSAVLLAQANADVVTRGEAFVVEADGDPDLEIGIARLELRSLAGNLCSLDVRAELWGASPDAARGLVRLDVRAIPSEGTLVDVVTALDGAGDPATASLVCAEALHTRPGPLAGQLCLQRIRSLVAGGRHLDAVNAAGMIAERAPALRAAVAGPLFSAMQALDQDPRLSAAPWDCAAAPLVPAAADKPTDEVIRLARARLAERLSLSDVGDAVFVTASRDFGTDTPVFSIATRWLERLRVTQPARYAAIEAALLPPAPSPGSGGDPALPTPEPPAVGDDGGPGFGGAP